MAKYNSSILCGFDIQTALGTYNASLAGIEAAGTWGGDIEGTDEGLLLGDADTGINGSGLTLTLGRQGKEQTVVGSSFTRPLSAYELTTVDSFQFKGSFGGSQRLTTVTTPVDADFAQLVGLDAIMRAWGFVSNTTSLSPGVQYRTGNSVEYLSFLGFVNGNEFQFQDCVPNSIVFEFVAGQIPTYTVDVAVGVVLMPSSSTPPTPPTYPTADYGSQLTVTPAKVENVGHSWNHTRGFSTLTITCTNTVDEDPDSNADEGRVLGISAQEIKVAATMYDDDTSTNEGYTASQLQAASSGELDSMSFQVGTTADATSSPAQAVGITVPQPELVTAQPTTIGRYSGYDIEVIARHSTANRAIDIDFV